MIETDSNSVNPAIAPYPRAIVEVRLFLLLVALSFQGGWIGILPPELNRFLGAMVLAGLGATYRWVIPRGQSVQWLVALGIGIVAVVFLVREGLNAIFGTALFLGALAVWREGRDRRDESVRLLLGVCLTVALIETLLDWAPHGPLLQAACSRPLAWALTNLILEKPVFGPSYSGFHIAWIFTGAFVGLALVSRPPRWRWFLPVVLGQAVMLMAAGLCLAWLLRRLPLGSPFFRLGGWHGFLLVLHFPLLLFAFRRARLLPLNFGWDWRLIGLSGASAVALIAFFLFAGQFDRSDSAPRRVFFYDQGVLNWDVPRKGEYGVYSGGMFGQLPLLLKARGHEVRKGGITAEALKTNDILVVINPTESLARGVQKEIWEFVARGGGLLVMGDHTGLSGIREPLNELLEPARIQFNFDSAIPVVEKWEHSLSWSPHPIFRGVRREKDLLINIGASLTARYPATPLIVGRHGYSDLGNTWNWTNGFLGDMHYQIHEPLGDMLLCAEGRHGRGKVVVFGDTTGFQNAGIALTHPFIDAMVCWLGSPGKGPLSYGWAYLFLFVPVCCVMATRPTGRAAFLLVLGCLVGILEYSVSGMILRTPERSWTSSDIRLAWIDVDHLNQASLDLWHTDGLGGLLYSMQRNGRLGLFLPKLSPQALAAADTLVLIAPQGKYSEVEQGWIRDFVSRGGHVIVAAGWEERRGIEGLLASFGLALRNIPLGALAATQNSAGLNFCKAWPIEVRDPQGTILSRAWDYPVIARQPHGKGWISLIADSQFLLCKNLEHTHDYWTNNIHFLTNLFPQP